MTSFVSLLLPRMLISRWQQRADAEYDVCLNSKLVAGKILF